MEPRYRRVGLASVGWRIDDVAVPLDYRARLLGWNGADAGAVLIAAASVHTFGVSERLRISALAADGTVLGSRLVDRRRLWTVRGAAWMLETEARVASPAVGSRVRIVPSSRNDARSTDALRNPHRQPR